MLVLHPLLGFFLLLAQASGPARAPASPVEPAGRDAAAHLPAALLLASSAPGPAHGPWRSRVRWCARTRDLHLVWDHEAFGVGERGPTRAPLRNREDLPVDGIVTAALTTDAGELVLALLDDEGAPRLERWELAWRPRADAALSTLPSGSTIREVRPERTAVHALWSTRDARYGAIEALALVRPSEGPCTQLLAYFRGSDEIASLPLWGGTLRTLLAEASGPPPEPSETQPRPRPVHAFVVRRRAGGFVYGLQVRLDGWWCGSGAACLASELQPRVPCLLDLEGDGVVERSERLPFATWELLGGSADSAAPRPR